MAAWCEGEGNCSLERSRWQVGWQMKPTGSHGIIHLALIRERVSIILHSKWIHSFEMCTHLIWLVFSSWAELSRVFLVGWKSLKSTWSQCTEPAVRNCGHKHSAVQEPSLPSAHEIGPEATSGAAPKCPVLCASRSPCAAPPGCSSWAGAGSSAPGERAHASQALPVVGPCRQWRSPHSGLSASSSVLYYRWGRWEEAALPSAPLRLQGFNHILLLSPNVTSLLWHVRWRLSVCFLCTCLPALIIWEVLGI